MTDDTPRNEISLKNGGNRQHASVGRLLTIELAIIAFSVTALAVFFGAALDWYYAREQNISEAVSRVEGYHAAFTNMTHRLDTEGIEELTRLIALDPDIHAFRSVNRFGKIVAEAGDYTTSTQMKIELEVPDDIDPSFIAARSSYFLDVQSFHNGIFERIILTLSTATMLGIFVVFVAFRRLKRAIVTPLEALHEAVKRHSASGTWASSGVSNPTEIAALDREIGSAFAHVSTVNNRIEQNIDALKNTLSFYGIAIRYYANDGLVTDFGQMTGPHVEGLLPDRATDGKAEFIASCREQIESAQAIVTETSLGTGSMRHILLQYALEFADRSYFTVTLFALQTGAFAIVIADVTQTRRMEIESTKRQRLEVVGYLSAGIAHDFNNILGIILGQAELLRNDKNQIIERLSLIIKACNRGSRLTKGLLSFARASDLNAQPMDVNDLASGLLHWSRDIISANIDVETVLDSGAWTIEADPAMAENALLNLILNARDAMPNGGRLTIETRNVVVDESYLFDRHESLRPGRYVVLSVTDTGTGMDKSTMDRIFDPFFTTKATGKGSGLGLSSVLGFMRQSNGTIRAYSEVDKGTTFKLFFPVTDKVRKKPALPRIGANEMVRAGHLLVVEDEGDLLNFVKLTLEASGHNVIVASEAELATEMFSKHPETEILITDVNMPGTMNGIQLASALRAKKPELKVILTSGHASEAIVHGNGANVNDIRLTKPVSRRELLEAVNKLLVEIGGAKTQ